MTGFKIEDRVEVVDKGRSFSTYETFLNKNFNEYRSLFKSGEVPKSGEKYKVVGFAPHETIPSYGNVYVIQDIKSSQVYLIGSDGLRKDPLPRICYLLGGEETPLEIGEQFEIEGYNGNPCHIRENGIVYNRHAVSVAGNWLCGSLNHPEKIIRKPKLEFTDDEKAMLRLYAGTGYLWVARDADEELYAFKAKPEIDNRLFFVGADDAEILETLLPQITFENSPIYIPDYVEVQKNG